MSTKRTFTMFLFGMTGAVLAMPAATQACEFLDRLCGRSQNNVVAQTSYAPAYYAPDCRDVRTGNLGCILCFVCIAGDQLYAAVVLLRSPNLLQAIGPSHPDGPVRPAIRSRHHVSAGMLVLLHAHGKLCVVRRLPNGNLRFCRPGCPGSVERLLRFRFFADTHAGTGPVRRTTIGIVPQRRSPNVRAGRPEAKPFSVRKAGIAQARTRRGDPAR